MNTSASDSIKENVPNRYSLVVLAAKRAKQIKEGAPLLIQTESTNPLTIALEEIADGKINYIEAVETEDDEAAGTGAPLIAPSVSAQPTAMQMLTESLDEAERAARFAEGEATTDESGEAEADAGGVDDGDGAADEENDDASGAAIESQAETESYPGAATSVSEEE